jgi:hypothetical protein
MVAAEFRQRAFLVGGFDAIADRPEYLAAYGEEKLKARQIVVRQIGRGRV